jgi:ABC-type polysaccharide/polyol phosphate transport system ATPase subunit
MSSEILVKTEGVSKKFCRSLKRSLWYGVQDVAGELFGHQGDFNKLRQNEFWALDDVSFELRRGECLGLIGRNGAGKTTLLRMLNGLIKPDKGRIEMRGRVGALIALGAGFNPILSGRENIYVNASVLGLSKKETDNRLEEIIDFAEVEEFIDSPVQAYSSGMQVRLGFAVASALEPTILLVDEVLAVGDFQFRNKCFNRINKLKKNGVAAILVSHNIHNIMQFSDFCLWLDKGISKKMGSTNEVCSEYVSSYLDYETNNLSSDSTEGLYGGSFVDESLIKNVAVSFTDQINEMVSILDPFSSHWLHYSFSNSGSEISGLTFKFFNEDGAVLFVLSNVLDQVDISTSEKFISGRIRVNALNLVPGRYVVVLVIQQGPEFIYRKVAHKFTISSSGNNIYPTTSSGFMQVDHIWEPSA